VLVPIKIKIVNALLLEQKPKREIPIIVLVITSVPVAVEIMPPTPAVWLSIVGPFTGTLECGLCQQSACQCQGRQQL
jgi:hypothetical protein